MSKISFLVLLGAVGFATCQYSSDDTVERTQPINYDVLRQKFVMYRVIPMNTQQVEALKDFCNSSPNVSIFSKIEDPGKGVDVLIKYSEMVSLMGALKQNTGISQMTALDKNIKMTFSRPYSPPSSNRINITNRQNQINNSPDFAVNPESINPNFEPNQMDISIPSFGPQRAAPIYPNWSGQRLLSYAKDVCITARTVNGVVKVEICNWFETMTFNQQTPSGYNFVGWFQFTLKNGGYGTYCLQAGSKTGYSQAQNGDRVILAPCVGDEPTQIWENAEVASYSHTYQYKDLGSGKCMCLDIASSEVVMWDCNWNADNHWWKVYP